MKKKIIILILSLFLLFLSGISIALYIVLQTTSNLDSLITLHKVEIIRQELVINVQTVQANIYTTGTQFGRELDVIVDNVLDLHSSAMKCSSCHHDPEVARNIVELQELTVQYKEALSYFITSTADRTRVERLQTIAADIGDAIIAKSQFMAFTANETLRRKTQATAEKVEKSKTILVITLLLAFFISVAVAVYLIRSITRPVAELLDATRRIRGGELGYRSLYQGHDEFQELLESFNDMSSSLKDTNEKILSHMTRNQTILQTSIDGFLLFDELGRIIDVNPALCKMTGYCKDELMDMNFSDIEVFNQQVAGDDILLRIKEARSLIFQVEQKAKSGKMVTVEISATFARMGGEGSYFCFVRDITARKKMEEELLKVQKLESLGVLAGGIAHDFNNLLTGILGYIDLSLRKIDPADKIYGWLHNAVKASRRAQNLTQQLLTFSKGGVPVKQPLRIAELIDDSTRFVLSGSNVNCETHLPDDTWLIEADKGQIGQVLQNIILNANQAMPGGGTLKIAAENVVVDNSYNLALPAGEYVRITFRDEGVGIDRGRLSKIFDPYYTTKQAGSGLGLTICYSIIDKHHGLLEAASEVGVGTTFTIYLPAMPRTDKTSASTLSNSLMEGSGKVLVMDDEEHVREIIADMLKDLGYEAALSRDGAEAIKLYQKAMAEEEPYLAVIMDLTIPGGMGGKETIDRLLEIDPQVKAIVSSGYSYDPIMAEHRKHGFKGVVTKPYDISLLSKTLHEVLSS